MAKLKHHRRSILEKMEAISFPVVDGVAMVYMDEDGNAVRPGKEKR